jgi:hypothetical protein
MRIKNIQIQLTNAVVAVWRGISSFRHQDLFGDTTSERQSVRGPTSYYSPTHLPFVNATTHTPTCHRSELTD